MFRLLLLDEWPHEDISSHNEGEDRILSFHIHEKEGQRPHACLTLENPYKHAAYHTFKKVGVLFEEIEDTRHILFMGYVEKDRPQIEGETFDLFLRGGKEYTPYHENSSQDPLAFLFREEDTPALFHLKCQGRLPYWCRRQGDTQSVEINQGHRILHLGSHFFRDSFALKALHAPVKKARRLVLSVEWMQRYMGETDLSFTIRTLFPGGIVNTFTGNSLKLRWWKSGQSLGKSRYWIDHSYLHEIPQPRTGILNLYSSSKISYSMSDKDPFNTLKRKTTVHLKRKWFRTQVILGWKYEQKRREELTIDLTDSTDDIRESEDIHIHLRRPDHLASPSDGPDLDPWRTARGRFFTTSLGQKAIACALQLATFNRSFSSRHTMIQLSVPWEVGRDFTTNTTLEIEDERLPNHRAHGKIIDLKATVCGTTGCAQVDVQIALQKKDPLPVFMDLSVSEPQPLQEGLDYPMALMASDLVHSAQVRFGPDSQQEYLRNPLNQGRRYLRHVLEDIKTEIHLILKDIAARPLLTRRYRLTLQE